MPKHRFKITGLPWSTTTDDIKEACDIMFSYVSRNKRRFELVYDHRRGCEFKDGTIKHGEIDLVVKVPNVTDVTPQHLIAWFVESHLRRGFPNNDIHHEKVPLQLRDLYGSALFKYRGIKWLLLPDGDDRHPLRDFCALPLNDFRKGKFVEMSPHTPIEPLSISDFDIDCRDCGACCSIWEVRPLGRLPEHLIEEKYPFVLRHHPGSKVCKALKIDGNKCSCGIYDDPNKPYECAEFKPGGWDCLNAIIKVYVDRDVKSPFEV